MRVIRSTSSVRQLLAAPDLVDDVGGRLGQEGLVVEFGGGALELLLRSGQILLEPAPLGGDVDGARGVEFDHDGAARQPHLHRGRRRESVRGGRQPCQRRHRRYLAVQIGRGDVGQPRRHLLPIGEPLIAAEPTHLGDQLLHIGDALGRNLIHREAGRGRPLGDDQRLAAGERLPQRLGDERHHRMQQLQQRVEDRGQHRRGVRDSVGQLHLGEFEVPVAELIPCEVVERFAGAAELVVVERRIHLGANLFRRGRGSSGRRRSDRRRRAAAQGWPRSSTRTGWR